MIIDHPTEHSGALSSSIISLTFHSLVSMILCCPTTVGWRSEELPDRTPRCFDTSTKSSSQTDLALIKGQSFMADHICCIKHVLVLKAETTSSLHSVYENPVLSLVIRILTLCLMSLVTHSRRILYFQFTSPFGMGNLEHLK